MILKIIKLIQKPKNVAVFLFVLTFSIFGIYLLTSSRASTPYVSINADQGNLNCATVMSNNGTNDGKIVIFNGTCSASLLPNGVPSNNGKSWNLTFDDEFNGSSLNTTNWEPNWLAGGNVSAITKPDNSDLLNCENPHQVSVSGGYLNLAVSHTPCLAINGTNYSWSGGLVNTLEGTKPYIFKSGYIEAKMYIPPASASNNCANWPSFWSDGNYKSGINWPTFGESDVMECGNGNLDWHFHSPSGAPGGPSPYPNGFIQSGWHILGANLKPGTGSCSGTTPNSVQATYYYDGVNVGTTSACINNVGMYIIVANDTGVPGMYGGPQLETNMLVDYVRSWQ